MSARRAFPIAWSLWIVSLVALVSPLVYRFVHGPGRGLGSEPGSTAPFVAVLVFIPTFATVGAVLAWKRPSNPIGWLLSASALSYSLGTFAVLLDQVSTRWADWISSWSWGLGLGLTLTFVLLLFPTGTLPSRRWRPIAWVAAISLAASTIGNAFAPGRIQDSHTVNPLGIGWPLGPVLSGLRGAFGIVLLAGLASLLSVVVRFRRSRGVEREQLKWLALAAAVIGLAFIVSTVVTPLIHPAALATNVANAIVSLSFLSVPIAIGIAVMKYRLYDIDLVIRRSVVFATLAAFIGLVYAAIVGGIGGLVGSRGNALLSFAAAAVLAVLFQPARDRARRLADRIVYGKRATPYEVLAQLSERMGEAYETEEVLPRMAQILAAGTGATTARVWLRIGPELRPEATVGAGGRVVSLPVSGDLLPTVPGEHAVEVRQRGELLGALSVVMPPSEPMNPTKDKLIRDLASQAGFVLRNVRLIEELRASRQRLVAAEDAERRRIERTIHDGVQQQLVELGGKLRLAERLADRDLDAAVGMVRDLQGEANDALDDLQDLARGIYPPLLADNGLAAALEAQARKSPVPTTIEPDGVGRYAPEIEAAVYFCTLEALGNVAKYATASSAVVSLEAPNDELTFRVTDDGRGFDPSSTAQWSGLQGMADRLDAVGGRLTVRSEPGSGTTIVGSVPVKGHGASS